MGVMQPENPLVGGTVLRRAAIQSPNFVSGSAGWTIKQDGSAEFNNVVIRNGQVISGTALYYSGAPAAGNLIASVAAVGGTDSFGNVYLAGVIEYQPSGAILNYATGTQGNSLNFWTGPAGSKGAGPWTLVATFGLDSTGTILLLGGPSSGTSLTGGFTADFESILASRAAGLLLDISNGTAAPAAANLRVTSAAAGDRTLSLQVSGDTVARFLADSNGALTWGPGGATLRDTTLARTAAGQLTLTSSLIAALLEVITGAASAAFIAEVTGDTNPRFQVLGRGDLNWGPGNAVVDTTLVRSAAGQLTVGSTLKTSGLIASGSAVDQVILSNGLAGGDVLKVTNTTAAPTGPSTHLIAQAAADRALGIQVAGDTVTRLLVDSNGKHSWGPGGASAQDVTMQRNAGHLDVTATDGNTYSAERLTQVNTGQTITTVSPTVTALTGLSAAVANGTTYRFRLWVAYNGSAAAGAPVFEITGPATSFSAAQLSFTTNGTATVTQRGAGLNTLQTGPTFQTAQQLLVWEGIFTPSANGTLAVSGATNTSGDNLVINGAALDLFPVI